MSVAPRAGTRGFIISGATAWRHLLSTVIALTKMSHAVIAIAFESYAVWTLGNAILDQLYD